MKPGKMVIGMMVTCVGLAISATAIADLPPALDRVPGETAVSITIREVATAKGKVEKFMGMLPIPDAKEPLAKLNEIMSLEGLNTKGSISLAMLSVPQEEGKENEDIIVIVPVTDYAAFAKSMKATGEGGGGGVQKSEMDGKPVFLKDIGGGYAAMGPQEALVKSFKGDAGHSGKHQGLIGAQAKSVGDTADALVIANFKSLRPMMEKGIAKMKDEMANGPAEAKKMAESMHGMMDGFVRDGQAGVVGISITNLGLKLDGAAQFAENSEWAGYFTGGKKSTDLLAKLPNQSFLMAAAMDTSSPGVKKMFKQLMDFAKKAGEAMPGGGNPMDMFGGGIDFAQMIEKFDGQAFVMGNSPAGLMGGGLFLNSSVFYQTKDPAGMLKTVKDMYGAMNGKTVQGLKYTTTYEPGSANVAGTPVDSWGMNMEAEPGNPQAEQMAMMMPMIFGEGGMGGYMAPATGGLVMTLSKNQPFLEQALKAAADGNGLSNESSLKGIASELPSDRSLEFYIGVQSIMEQVGPMIGMEAGDEQIPPLAIAGAHSSGGMRFTMFMPNQLINLIGKMSGGAMAPGADEEDAGQPGF